MRWIQGLLLSQSLQLNSAWSPLSRLVAQKKSRCDSDTVSESESLNRMTSLVNRRAAEVTDISWCASCSWSAKQVRTSEPYEWWLSCWNLRSRWGIVLQRAQYIDSGTQNRVERTQGQSISRKKIYPSGKYTHFDICANGSNYLIMAHLSVDAATKAGNNHHGTHSVPTFHVV